MYKVAKLAQSSEVASQRGLTTFNSLYLYYLHIIWKKHWQNQAFLSLPPQILTQYIF